MIVRQKIRNPTESDELLKHYSFVFVNLFTTCGGGSGGVKDAKINHKSGKTSLYNKVNITPNIATAAIATAINKVVGSSNGSNRKRGLVNIRAMNLSHDRTPPPNSTTSNNNDIEKKLMPPPHNIPFVNQRLENILNSATPCTKKQKQEHTTTAAATTQSPPKSQRRVEVEYDIRDELGSGTCGQVRRAIHRKTGQMVAIKIISLGNVPGSLNRKLMSVDDSNDGLGKDNEESDNAMRMVNKTIQEEASILQSLDHPYIIKLIDVFVHPKKKAVYLVMELVQGGDLFDRIIQKERYSETDSRRVMRRLLAAIHYLHEKRDIVHRDLKPENILCVSRHDDVHVKLTDFGLAKSITEDGLKTFCGTPQVNDHLESHFLLPLYTSK